MPQRSPFRYFGTNPEIVRLAVMLYVGFRQSLRNVEDLLHERGIEVSQERVRFWGMSNWFVNQSRVRTNVRVFFLELSRPHYIGQCQS